MLTNLKMLISNTTLIIWNPGPKNVIKAISVPNLRVFIFGWNFVFGKIWGCSFKAPQYSSFSEIQPKNTQIRQFCSDILKRFFARNFTFWQIEGAAVKHDKFALTCFQQIFIGTERRVKTFCDGKRHGRHEVSIIQVHIFVSMCVVDFLTSIFLFRGLSIILSVVYFFAEAYSFKNICQMEIFVTVYLQKEYLLNK